MGKLQTTFLIVLVILTIITSLFVQVLIGFKTTILNPNYYDKLIVKHNLHDLPQNYVLLSIKKTSGDLFTEPICNVMPPAINETFSDEWAREKSQGIITHSINYIKGKEKDLQLDIHLQDRKDLLKDNIISNLGAKYKPKELEVFNIMSTQELAETIVESPNWPNSLNIIKALGLPETKFLTTASKLQEYYSLIKFAPYLLFLLFVTLLIFVGKNGLGTKWLGYGVLISALVAIIITYVASNLLDDYLINNISNQSELLITIGTNPFILVSVIKNSLINSIHKISIAFAFIGTALFVWGKIWSDRHLKGMTNKFLKT